MIARFCGVLLLLTFVPSGLALADDDPATDANQQRSKRLDAMRQLADGMRVFVDGESTEIKRIDKHLMRHNDATRQYQDGTMWAYGQRGRPHVISIIQTSDATTGNWWTSATSLSTESLRVSERGRIVWQPNRRGITFQPMSRAAAPAKSAPLRLIQLRNLAQRFTAHQFWDPDNQRYQLRLLRQPIYRYEDPKAKIIDGAVLGFLVNTHPELLLVLEAVEGDDGPQWQYGFAKIGSAEFHAQLDGDPVYKSDRAEGVVGRVNDTYRLFSSKLAIDE